MIECVATTCLHCALTIFFLSSHICVLRESIFDIYLNVRKAKTALISKS